MADSAPRKNNADQKPQIAAPESVPEIVLHVQVGAEGVADTGATRNVMGSECEAEFRAGLPEEVSKLIKVVPSGVTFRFGNNQTLRSMHKLAVPILDKFMKPAC